MTWLALLLGCAARTSLASPVVPQAANDYALRISAIADAPGVDEPHARISLIEHGAHERTLYATVADGICAHRACTSDSNFGVECWWKGEVDRYCLETAPSLQLRVFRHADQNADIESQVLWPLPSELRSASQTSE